MRDSQKWGMVSGICTILGIVFGWVATSKQKEELQEDKEYFNNVAQRIERSMNDD